LLFTAPGYNLDLVITALARGSAPWVTLLDVWVVIQNGVIVGLGGSKFLV
jgi:hypothetical protein